MTPAHEVPPVCVGAAGCHHLIRTRADQPGAVHGRLCPARPGATRPANDWDRESVHGWRLVEVAERGLVFYQDGTLKIVPDHHRHEARPVP